MEEKISYSEAIEKVMLNNNYFAPLKLIYKEIWKYKDRKNLKGKTPEKTIQERVQRDKKFIKIGLGVWALTEHLNKLPKKYVPKSEKERAHSKIQGMLLEIGNSKKEVENTYTNDKKFIFQGKPLKNLSTIDKIPPFTYKKIIEESVRYFDVIWFNKRGFPEKIFEVEDTTNFRNAFTKFMELQDFVSGFICVSREERKKKFDVEINKNSFEPINKGVKFRTYEGVKKEYNHSSYKSIL